MSRVRGRVRAMNGEFSGGTGGVFGRYDGGTKKTNPALLKVLANPFSLANGFQGKREQPSDAKPYEDEAIAMAPGLLEVLYHGANQY